MDNRYTSSHETTLASAFIPAYIEPCEAAPRVRSHYPRGLIDP